MVDGEKIVDIFDLTEEDGERFVNYFEVVADRHASYPDLRFFRPLPS